MWWTVFLDCIAHRRQGDALLSQPQMNLSNALEFGELGEHQRNGFAHPQIWVHHDPVMPHLDVADGDGEEKFATPGLLPQGLQRALPQDRQLQLTHCTLRTHDILPSNSRLRSS